MLLRRVIDIIISYIYFQKCCANALAKVGIGRGIISKGPHMRKKKS